MRRCALLALVACGYISQGPKSNEAVGKTGRKITWRAPIALATFCKTCGRDAPVTIEFGAPVRARLVIPLCYAHAQSKIGDHDNFQVALIERSGSAGPRSDAQRRGDSIDGNVAATAGELDIEDCTSKHVIATLKASFPDNRKIDAQIDTDLTDPGK